MKPDDLICLCGYVTREEIVEAVEMGNTFRDLQVDLDVCNGCGGCLYRVENIINEINMNK